MRSIITSILVLISVCAYSQTITFVGNQNGMGNASFGSTPPLGGGGGSGTNFTAAWSMNEASGNRIDCKASLALVPNGTVTQVAGKVSNAVHLGGTSADYLSMAANSNIQMGPGVHFSITFWFKSDTGTVGANTFTGVSQYGSAGQKAYLCYFVAASAVFNINDNEVTTPFAMDTSWHFYCAVYDGSTIKVSIDGGTQGSAAYSSDAVASTANFVVGNIASPTSAFAFPGAIDEVVIYKWALQPSDIATRYNAGAGRAECSFP